MKRSSEKDPSRRKRGAIRRRLLSTAGILKAQEGKRQVLKQGRPAVESAEIAIAELRDPLMAGPRFDYV